MGDYSEVHPPSNMTVYDDSTSITVLPNGRKWRRTIGFTSPSPSGDRVLPEPYGGPVAHDRMPETTGRRA